jgi:tungstate transport system substrate-binding protein
MKLNWRVLAAIAVVAVLVVATVGYLVLTQDNEKKTLRMATTTSTYDSGLLDYLLPVFEEKYNCQVDVIAVGSGQALEMGKKGDVDVLLVHSPASEIKFVSDGYGESRTLVMYNNFVVVGPTSDPAGTNVSKNTTQAFVKIHDNGTANLAKFISRGDNSGTYTKELSLWTAAGYNASLFSNTWYQSAGQGMGAVLDMCEQMNAYTLSDDATYYQRVSENLIPHLNITYQGDPGLFNQYSVIPVNATKWTHINHTLALDFKDWITSAAGQDLIASYVKYGHQLFFPNTPGYMSSTLSVRMNAHTGIPLDALVREPDQAVDGMAWSLAIA